MQLMCDAIAVLGSRHGLMFDPVSGQCHVIRFDNFTRMPAFQLRAGTVIDGREYVFPLCKEGTRLGFFDQRITPCTSRFIGIDPGSGIKVTLSFVTPFRPRDGFFSTLPVIGIRMQAERIAGNYRWTPVTTKVNSVDLFVEMSGGDITWSESEVDALTGSFVSNTTWPEHRDADLPDTEWHQTDRLLCVTGQRTGSRFQRRVALDAATPETLDLAWCTYNEPVLKVWEDRCPFAYTERFKSLNEVTDWVRTHLGDLFENARQVDTQLVPTHLPSSVQHLMAYTLHSWLANTWWVKRPDGRDWFSVWEGICHFHSTVDVEFTQSPFYLCVWPELLGIELDYWPEFSKDGAGLLGERGTGTQFLSHDCGQMARADGQAYPHDMEVEETTNYLILLYAHWKRTGDFSIAATKADVVRKYLAFLVACDTTGNGVPDRGIANTIDDASPAIQYGREQVYLGVKTLAAFRCGAALLEQYGDAEQAAAFTARAGKLLAVIEEKGWMGDHYATLLDKRTEGVVNPWTGATLNSEEVPGWDACHIFTANAVAVLDMVGMDIGLNRDRLITDMKVSAERCLQEYGCAHTDYTTDAGMLGGVQDGMVGVGGDPGWISMNMLRDIAAACRGLDLHRLSDRYWAWQVTTNTQQPGLFFETFGGNNLCFYPRGVAIWGLPEALASMPS